MSNPFNGDVSGFHIFARISVCMFVSSTDQIHIAITASLHSFAWIAEVSEMEQPNENGDMINIWHKSTPDR